MLAWLARWGYKDVRELAGVVANYSAAGIPLDTIWSDIDYMHGWRDFTLDPDNFSAPDMRVCRVCVMSLISCSTMHVLIMCFATHDGYAARVPSASGSTVTWVCAYNCAAQCKTTEPQSVHSVA